MTGSDRRGDAEWPIGSDEERPASPDGGRALRFGGEHERQVRYDDARTNRARGERIRSESAEEASPAVRTRRGISPVLLALGGLILLLLLAWLLLGKGNPDQDKLTNVASSGANSAPADPEKLCASKATYDGIKRELFRRAAQVRGGDQATFDRISAYAVLRIQNPVMESQDSARGAVNCSGSLSLDLPPGLAVVGGRTSLASDIDYSVQRAADNSGNIVLLKNADAIITPLATLARTATAQPETPPASSQQPVPIPAPAPGAAAGPVQSPPPAPITPAPAVQPRLVPRPGASAPPVRARPSFNCANARTRGEIAVCSDPDLAALDRQMASQFVRALSQADPMQRSALERTRNRFLGYRDRCGSAACIADAYRGRMEEISDIMGR